MHEVVYFLFVYNFTDHRDRSETHLQLLNIICHMLSKLHDVMLQQTHSLYRHPTLPILHSTFLIKWNRMLHRKLIVSQLANISTEFHVTRRYITVFTTALHLPLSSARLIHSTLSLLVYLRSISIYFLLLRLDLPRDHHRVSLPKYCMHFSCFHTCHIPLPSSHPHQLFYFTRRTSVTVQI